MNVDRMEIEQEIERARKDVANWGHASYYMRQHGQRDEASYDARRFAAEEQKYLETLVRALDTSQRCV